MFGSRLKSWMENYIGRPRKKDPQKDKPKGGPTLESSESLAHSDTGISSSSQQVLSSSTTDNREGYSTTTMESEKSEMTNCYTAISLPSPESAYSTGYSTDGASPGATGAPEYYINIRTGKHYFPSPAPTPTSPLPNTTFLPQDTFRYDNVPPIPRRVPEVKSPKKSTKSSLKLFLKSPKQEKDKPKLDLNKTPILDGKKPKKWFKQPFRKFAHRRGDLDERMQRHETQKISSFCYLLSQDNSASPRQRNRIKTNPWLPTEPMSALNFHTLVSPSLARNRSCSNTPLQNRKVQDPPARIKHVNLKPQDEKRHPRLLIDLSDHSEEDLTLNEMMGTYNESYVYEKETDILSDSDPTDCEDYGTDSEAENGGDERDSHDDELDFIDNGSITDCDDKFPRNTGKCSYYDVKKSSFLSSRHHSRKDSKARREKRRPARKSFKREEPKPKVDEPAGGLSKALMVRMMANVSKSAEGTPMTIRKLRETHITTKPDITDVEDTKYKELIKQAEDMIQTMRNSPVIKTRKSPKHLGLKLSTEAPKSSFKTHSPLDPLGPALRNFSVFKPTTDVQSSSEDIDKRPVIPIAFQSVDLGKPLTSYCPQSEPVKRKIYSCSKTYDRLVKQFEKPTIFEETNGLETCLNGNQGSEERLFRGGAFHGSFFSHRKTSAGPQRRSFDGNIFT